MKYQLLFCALVCLLWYTGCTPVQEPTDTTPPTAAQSAERPEAAITATQTIPITATMTVTATATLTATAVVTATAPATSTAALTPSPTATLQPVTPTPPPVSSPSPTATPPGATPTPGTPTATSQPTASATPSPTPTSEATPTPAPAAVFIRSQRDFVEGGNLVVVGELVNGLADAIFGAKVIGTFYDSGGRLIGAQEGLAYLPQTISTQTNPFRIQLAGVPSDMSRYDLTLAWDDISIAGYDRLTVASENARKESGLEVYGELRNDHPQEMRSVVVVVTFYDAAGEVVDAYVGAPATASLAPSATTPYSIKIANADLPYASFRVQAQGSSGLQ